ncbi:hypothetical protein [Calditerricola satsumensis]|nr:hypothetical protein [Calditerricola satsumensis]
MQVTGAKPVGLGLSSNDGRLADKAATSSPIGWPRPLIGSTLTR